MPTLEDLQRYLLSLGTDAGEVVNSLMGAGTDEAEAARGRSSRISISQPMATPVSAPVMTREQQEALQANTAVKQAEAEARQMQIADAKRKQEGLDRFIAAQAAGSSIGEGGQSRAYAVPQDMRGQFGEYYLTNSILPTAQTPKAQRSFENGRNIPNAPLTPASDVDFGRVLAGNYDKQYSTGNVQQAPEPTWQDRVNQGMQSGVISPEAGMKMTKPETDELSRQATINQKGQRVWATKSGKPSNAPVASAIPAGFQESDNGELVPIHGGPADIKYHQQRAMDQASYIGLTDGLERMSKTAGQLLDENKGGVENIAGKSNYLPFVGGTWTLPGTAAADAKARLETLKAKVGFEVLQQMRNNSKTGGALGQVSDAENKLLQQAIDSLDAAQSDAQLLSAIQEVKDTSDRIAKRYKVAYETKWGNPNNESSNVDNAAIAEAKRRGLIK